jgi:hypothetical protein
MGGVGEAGHPAGKASQVGVQVGMEPQVGDADSTAGSQGAGQVGGGVAL